MYTDNGHCTPVSACMSVSIVVLYLFDQYVPVLTSVYLFRFLCLYKSVLCAIDGGITI